MRKWSLLFKLVLCLSYFSCIDDNLNEIDGILAEPEYAVPIGKASFTIKDFINQDSIFEVGNDGFVSIKYRQDSVLSLSAADFMSELVDLWDVSYVAEKAIGSAPISGVEETGMFYMQALVNEIPDPTVKQFFNDNDGNTVPLPPFDQLVNFDIGIPVFDEFQEMEIESGNLNFKALNTYPFDLEDVTFEIWDNITGTIIGTIQKELLMAGAIFEDQVPLDGLTFNNSIFVRLKRFKSPGSTTPVLLNLMNRINVEMTITDLKIKSGVVKVPASIFDEIRDIVDVQTDNDVKLKSAKIQSGTLKYSLNSSVDLPLELKFDLPTVSEGTTNFTQTIFVENGNESGVIDISNHVADFGSVQSQPYNRLPVKISAKTAGSDQNFISFDSEDLVKIDFQLENLIIEQFVGNAGTYTRVLDSSRLDFDIDFGFLEPETEAVFFENPKIEIFYANSFGIPMEADLDVMAFGQFGTNEGLNPPLFVLEKPNLQQIGQSISSEFAVDKSNSNLVDMISVFPISMDYSGQVVVNPTSNGNIDNFVTLDSKITAGVDVDLPLKFKASLIALKDTLSNAPIRSERPEEIESVELILDYRNDLPFNTTIELLSYRAGIETKIAEPISLTGAKVDSNGKTIEPYQERISINLDNREIETILLNELIILNVDLATQMDGNSPASIYTTNGIEVGLAAKVKLRIQE